MLTDDRIFELSLAELNRVWKRIKGFNCVLVGGWAAHMFVDEGFRKERRRRYIGSKDIDFAVLSDDLLDVFREAERMGFFPLSFRYCKLYSRSMDRFLSEEEGAKHPLHDLFYLFLDFITDKKPEVEFMVFEDEVVRFIFENRLFVNRKGMRVMPPELLVLSKLRILKDRSDEKRAKDVIDSIMLYTFYEGFDNSLFRELSERFGFDRKFARKEVRNAHNYLKMLGFSDNETTNLEVSFMSLI